MGSHFIPAAILPLVETIFAGDEVHGQLATIGMVSTDQQTPLPNVRTVHFRLVNGLIVFNTNSRSQKWQELVRHGVMAACYYDEKRQIQLRWQGGVRLITAQESDAEAQRLRIAMWGVMRQELKRGYWLDHLGYHYQQQNQVEIGIDHPSPTFATVVCEPNLWDVYERHMADHFKGVRICHEFVQGSWRQQSRSIFSGQLL